MSDEGVVEIFLSETVGHEHPHGHDKQGADEYEHNEHHVHRSGHLLFDTDADEYQYDHHWPGDHDALSQ